MGRSRLLMIAILLVIAAAAMGGIGWHFAARRPSSKAVVSANEAPPQASNAATANDTTSAAASATPQPSAPITQPAATKQIPGGPLAPVTVGDIQFIPWETMPTTKVTWQDGGYEASTNYAFRRIGRFVSGPYQGASLLLAFISIDDVCKGNGCDSSYAVRYIQKGGELLPLPKLSDAHVPDESVGRKGPVDLRPLKDLGAASAQPLDFSFPALEYPAKLQANPRAVLDLSAEGVGLGDPALLRVAFHDPVYGDVWVTKSEVGPQRAFYEECTSLNGASPGDSDTCADMRPYKDNAFYVFRPDGTYLKYGFAPDFRPERPKDVTWNDRGSAGANYDARTLVGCSQDVADDLSVVSPKLVSEADLQPIGKVNATGDTLYGLKDKKHRLYQEFYEDYDNGFPKWAEQKGEHSSGAKRVSYEDFLSARPLFLWKDPFGRLIRFVNTEFVIPQTCEPILYLYPEKEEQVEVKLGEEIAVTASSPAYRDGWSVSAQPDGHLVDLRSGRRMPSLFWEGHSSILPNESKGFVVASGEVKNFLESELPQLGLNEQETHDFVGAWAAKLTESPYYFIAFVEQSVVDRYYPLRIYPPPDAIIRVFMDFKPLGAPVPVQPLPVHAPPQRRGFTAVEWGVLVR